MDTDSGIYACDPQPAEIAFALSPIPIGVHEGFINGIRGRSK
jgi:hypothetical protein